MQTETPSPVKYFIAALYSDQDILNQAFEQCEAQIGRIDLRSDAFPFEVTSYYHEEMGAPLFRLIVSFDELFSPGELARLKLLTNEIEATLRIEESRKVNLDVGYMDLHKLVLASAKYNGQKIYLERGIYADTTLIFEKGRFKSVQNTFPDFKGGVYDAVILEMRNRYKAQLRKLSPAE